MGCTTCLRLLLFPLLLLHIIIRALEPDWTLPNCDSADFYKPYVRISITRKGFVLQTLHNTGFIDVRPYSGVVCINGPTIIYSTDDFSMGEPSLFFHGCLTFNRRNPDSYKSGDNQSAVVGHNKFTGIFLLTSTEDYRRSAFFFFPGNFFRIPLEFLRNIPSGGVATTQGVSFPGAEVHDSSFAMVTNDGGMWGSDEIEIPPKPSSYCFNLSHYDEFGVVHGRQTVGMSPMFCLRQEGEDIEFDEVFTQNPNLSTDMFSWTGCGENGDGDGSVINSSLVPNQLPDFRIVHPGAISEPSPGQWFIPGLINSTGFYASPPPPSSAQPNSTAETGIVSVTLTDCEEVIPVPDCDETINSVEACDLLGHVLTQNMTDWTDPKLNAGSWRRKVMTQFVNIYKKVCPQVSPALPTAIISIVSFFINRIASRAETQQSNPSNPKGEEKWRLINQDKTMEWKQLITELNNCEDKAFKLPLYCTKDPNNVKRKKDLEQKLEQLAFNPDSSQYTRSQLDEAIKEVRVMEPYRIWLPPPVARGNGTKIRLGRHIEAAEVDYDLDWVIDSFWRIYSTVIGYCIPHFSDFPDNKVFVALHANFTTDFLDLVVEQWTHAEPLDEKGNPDPNGKAYIFGNFDPVYQHLFGEYVGGLSSRYMEACNDGSYWQSWFPDWRLPRPIYLKPGPNVTDNRTLNFFIAHPLMPNYDPDLYGS